MGFSIVLVRPSPAALLHQNDKDLSHNHTQSHSEDARAGTRHSGGKRLTKVYSFTLFETTRY